MKGQSQGFTITLFSCSRYKAAKVSITSGPPLLAQIRYAMSRVAPGLTKPFHSGNPVPLHPDTVSKYSLLSFLLVKRLMLQTSGKILPQLQYLIYVPEKRKGPHQGDETKQICGWDMSVS